MDDLSKMMVLSLFMKTILWRKGRSIQNKKVKLHWSDVHLATVHDYFINLYPSCYFTHLRFARLFNVFFRYAGPGSSKIGHKIAASFAQELHQFFRVPTLKKFHEEEYEIKKHQLVQVFLSFLLELIYYKSESFDPYENQIQNLEKDLRFLLTILGDNLLMLCGEEHEEEFKNLMAEFEAAANEAGNFTHSLIFSSDCSSKKRDKCLVVVLNHTNILKSNIMGFLNHLACTSKPAYTAPDTSLVDSFVLNSLVHDIEDLILWEDNPTADVMDQIKVLHQGLNFLQSSVKDVEIVEMRELLKRIGNLAHQTEYLIVSFSSGDAPPWYLVNRLADINQKVKLLGVELQEIRKKHKLGDLKVANHSNTQGGGRIEIDDVIVGFKDREPDVLDYLIGRGKSLKVISISGMPGVGKTTLAKNLFNHPSVNSWFDMQSWCVVSQTYQSQNILADLLIQINGEFSKDSTFKMDSKSLVVQIHQTLWGRRYLIVMDDVWNSNLWDDLVGCFPDGGNGSRILFTTRNRDVGPTNCDDYAVPLLSIEECWELLEKKVFGNNNTCPPQLIGIGKEIAADCWGLPLAVVVIAGILSTMDKEKYIWEEVRGNLASYIFDGGDNSVMQILELSYKHLPERLKPCFLYFGAFLEGKEIPVGKLMRLWISEGFIHKAKGKSAEDVAEEHLMELIDKNLVMVARRRSDGGVKTCVLHDLLQDLCNKTCEIENFIKEEQGNIYSVYENGLRPQHRLESRHYKSWSYCQQVRSLHGMHPTSPLYLRRMRLLRVLHFDFISDHLTGIEHLINLRYLVIRDLPASLGRLMKLEYLRVETQKIVYLPPEILRMVKLRYLNANCARYGRHCDSFQTNNLEFLSCISIRKLKDEEMLKCSPNLRTLKCMYERGHPYSNFDLCYLSRLQSLKLLLYGPGVTEISFPSNIKKLSLYGRQNLPWEGMPIIGRLEKLEVLKLGLTGFEGERWETGEGEFQKLKFLKLDGLQDLTEWNVESSSHFPALQRLVLSHCEKLLEIPCEIGEIASLQLMEVTGRCVESLVESAKVMQHQQCDMGNEDLRILINAAITQK